MTRAGRWLRVSTLAQDEASQEPDEDKWIAEHGYEVTATYRVHGASAFHGKHEPELRQAMADIASGKIEVLVVWKSDRLERRGAWELMGLVREARQAGGRIEFVTEPMLNVPQGPMGDMILAFYGGMANSESATKSDRVRVKHQALRAAGSFAGGKVPYGYSLEILDGRKVFAPDDNADVVKRIFAEVASGASFSEVAKGLTAAGIPTYTGKAVWAEKTIGQIIANVVYRGLVQREGQTYQKVEPLVSSADWLKANQTVKAKAQSRGHGTRGRPTVMLLKPTCECGGPMYRYGPSYRCAGLGPGGNSAQRKGCGNTIKTEVLDAEVWKEFAEHDEPLIETTTIPGSDHAEAIAAVELATNDLKRSDPDYRARRDALDAEYDRLVALPVEPDRVVSVRVEDKTEGDAFREMTPDEQRAEIRKWRLTVWLKDSEHQNALAAAMMGRRWTLARKKS